METIAIHIALINNSKPIDMPEFTIRPLSVKGERILTEDIIVASSTVFSAKMQAEMICPDCYQYQIVDMQELISHKSL